MLYHFAYTFDSDTFHDELRTKVVRENKLDTKLLHELAKVEVAHASEELKLILSYLRYDEELLEDPDGDASNSTWWYTIILAGAFKPCPSLSNNRYLHSASVLKRFLPLAGWEPEEIDELIIGKKLSEFLERPEDQIFANNLTLFRNYLNRRQQEKLLFHLETSIAWFSLKTPELQLEIEKYVPLTKLLPDQIPDVPCLDALDMLKTALQRNEALYLLWDY